MCSILKFDVMSMTANEFVAEFFNNTELVKSDELDLAAYNHFLVLQAGS